MQSSLYYISSLFLDFIARGGGGGSSGGGGRGGGGGVFIGFIWLCGQYLPSFLLHCFS